jgi:flagellar basal-body rod protein FlgC
MSKTLNPIEIAGSGLKAQKMRMELIAANIANVDTILTKEGSFYKRQTPVFESVIDSESRIAGVRVKEIVAEQSQGILKYEPQNPYADSNGFVRYPDISIVREMTELISAQRAYEANLAVASSVKSMMSKALEI